MTSAGRRRGRFSACFWGVLGGVSVATSCPRAARCQEATARGARRLNRAAIFAASQERLVSFPGNGGGLLGTASAGFVLESAAGPCLHERESACLLPGPVETKVLS